MKIGVFDSGLGGLTVLRTIRARFPKMDLIYFADTARCPYGVRNGDEVAMFSQQIARFLISKGATRLVIACNTATVYGLSAVRDLGIPSIGMIEAGTHVALRHAKNTIGILATEGTIRSRAYEEAIHMEHPELSVIGVACPKLVEIAESGMIDTEEARETFISYMGKAGSPDTVIFGCTHFPLYRDYAQKAYPKVYFADPADGVVEMAGFFENKGDGDTSFYTTGDEKTFERLGSEILRLKVKAIKVDIDSLTKEGEDNEDH